MHDDVVPPQCELVPHWLMERLGCKGARFTVSAQGIALALTDGRCYNVLNGSLASGGVVRRWPFFCALVLLTEQGEITLRGLREGDAHGVFAWLQRIIYQHMAPTVKVLADALIEPFQGGYLRTSQWRLLQSQAQQCVAAFGQLPPEGVLTKDQYRAFDRVLYLAQCSDDHLMAWREHYVAQMKLRYQSYFDRVESHPLTPSQREACVVDEDNNLVLAGAGTGKTSTMVGRAGFLLHSGQAQPEQILLLAFAREAAEEMQARLKQRLQVHNIEATTFHSLGMRIIAEVEGGQPVLSPMAQDVSLLVAQVDEWFEQNLRLPDYKAELLDYFEAYLYPETDPFAFATEGDYYQHILANELRTLNGEAVASIGGCLIANHLLKLGVEYICQPCYENASQRPEYSEYKPDFYLPEYGIYIAHFIIDGDGNTPPYVDAEAYHQGIRWQREVHQQHQTCLLETYHYELCEHQLLSALEARLRSVGVEFAPLADDAMLEVLRDFGAVPAFSQLLADLLKRWRSRWLDADQLEQAIVRSERPDQLRAAILLLQPILCQYDSHLVMHGQIDFDEMVGQAIDYVTQGRFRSPWHFILVDEFQDISDPRARLIKALRASVPSCSLFCVGDDWQAIYRFTGSDIAFTTEFERHFGPTKITALGETFRFNDSICQVASRFIVQNPAQVNKQLTTHTHVEQPAVSLLRGSRRGVEGGGDSRLTMILSAIDTRAAPGSSVYLLARYRFQLPEAQLLGYWRQCYPQLQIECMTLHVSKGKEADYVVLLGLENGTHGFPSRKVTHPLLEALLPAPEPFAFAEERRLFYVGLTRARLRVYLLVDMATASDFVVELLDDHYPIETDEFASSFAQRLFRQLSCTHCATGTLVGREGRFGAFYGCSNFPLCDHVENGCNVCAQPMRRSGRCKVCIDPDCTGWAPICPECGAEMIQREGQYGTFWGCRNYRGNDAASCQHTEQHIVRENMGEAERVPGCTTADDGPHEVNNQ